MTSNVRLSTGLLAVLVVPFVASASAAQIRTALPDDGDAHASLLDRRAGLIVRDVTLETALTRLTETSGVFVVFSPSLLRADARKVTCDCKRLSVGDALDRLLGGTDFRYTVMDGQVALVPKVTVPGPVVPRLALARFASLDDRRWVPTSRELTAGLRPRAMRVAAQGSIAGRVTDAVTGAGIPGANVLLRDTRLGTTTDAEGRYRLVDVPVGDYTLAVERIGYGSVTRAVSVAEGAEVTVNFELGLSPTALDEIVVTGTLVPTQVRGLPTPISVVTAEDIERNNIRRLEDAIRLAVPGATVWDQSTNPAGVMQVSLRGTSGIGSGNSPKYYIDGIETTSRGTTWLDPRSIERIEVLRGPQAAAVYGSDAMGGVVQVFTKRGSAQRRPEIEASAAVGTVESAFSNGVLQQDYNASIHGQNGSASYRVGGGYSQTGEWAPDYSRSTPSVHGGVRVSDGPFTFDLSARLYDLNIESSTDPRFREAAPAIFPTEHAYTPFRSRNETYAVQLEHRPTEWWQHQVTAGVDRYSLNVSQTRARLTTPADTFLQNNVQHGRRTTLRYTTSVTSALGPGLTANLTAGVDHQSFATDLTIASATTTKGLLSIDPASFLVISRNRRTNTGVFGQAQFNLAERFFVTGAVRAEWNSDFGDDLVVPLSPRAGLTYVQDVGTATLKLRAAYGEAIRPPFSGANEGSVGPFVVILPNASIKPERQVGPDVGIDLFFGQRGSLSVTYYDQLVKDLIESVPIDATSFPTVTQYQNISRVRNEGWEFEGSLRLGLVALRGQYAISRSEAEQLSPSYAGDVKVGEQMISIPRRIGSVTLTATPFQRTSVAASMTYTGAWRFYDFLAFYGCLGETGPCDGFALGDYLTDYPSFAQLTVSIERQLTPVLSAYVNVEDLADSGSARSGGNNAVATGRTTMIGARVRY